MARHRRLGRLRGHRGRGRPGAPAARPLAWVATLLVGMVALAGCTGAGADPDPTWVPAPSLSALPLPTPDTGESQGSSPQSPDPQNPSPSQPRSSGPAIDPNVVATKLNSPVGIAVLPDGTALVGERATGRIVQVQPVAGKPVRVVRTLTGLDASGGGGLLDLALSATFSEDGLVLALVSTRTDVRLVHFTLTGPVTPILTGIPRGRTVGRGRLLVLDSGLTLIGTGDTGSSARAVDPRSLAGKVLRVDDLGRPAPGNPRATSRVYTSGQASVDGLCVDGSGRLFEVEAGPRGDELNVLQPGATYGGSTGTVGQTLPAAVGGVSGCAVSGPAMYFSGRGGRDLFRAAVDRAGRAGDLKPVLNHRYGRLATVVPATDGSLWLTTTNRDGSGRPIAADERVLHIQPPSGGGGSSPA